MAGEPLVSLIDSLTSLALQEANRIANVKEPIESLEKELQLMNPLMKSIENTVGLDQNAAQWLQETHGVFLRAEDLVSQYRRRLAKRKWVAIFEWPYLKERYELALELETVTRDIHDLSQKGIQILNDRNLNLPFSSEVTGGNITDSALNKLNVFLSQNSFLPDDLLERLIAIRDEMAPFDKFLTEVEAEELDERQKVWLQEIKDIFQLLDESLLSFQCSRENETKYYKCFPVLLMLDIFRESEIGLKEKIKETEKRIVAVTSRYELCAIGEFKARNGLGAIVPQMRSHKKLEPVKSSSLTAGAVVSVWHRFFLNPFGHANPLFFPSIFRCFREILVFVMLELFSFSKKPSVYALEQFRTDLKLMKALFEDASKMGDSDKRFKVWLEQIREIYDRLETFDSYAKGIIEGRMGLRKILSLPKIVRESNEIEKEIHDALVRKTRYDIGSFVARNGNREVQSVIEVGSGQSTASGKLKEQVQLIKELQLIDAFLEDVNTMEKLDARLKVWLQEILGVAQEARAIVEQDFRGISGSFKVARKMRKTKKWIDDICEWKMKYDIQGIKATNGSSRISHNLEAAEAYPSGTVAAEFESLRREVKLMKALDDDIQDVAGRDGKLKAWMEEMQGVTAEAEKFIEDHSEITRRRGMPYILLEHIIQEKASNSILHIKDNIQKLHERRIRYGIEKMNRIAANIDGEVTSRPENETVSEMEILLMQLNEEATSRPEASMVNHENVPSYLWRCLFYFLLFPAGMEIPARRLIAVWIAEGLVGPKRGENKPAEYFCQLHLYELIRRRMIKATKKKLNGNFKAYQLCDDMQEMVSEKAKEANFFQDASAMTFRLAHYANRSTSYEHIDGSKPCSSSVLKAHYKKVISFFSFDTEEGGKHGDNIGNFLHRCISNRCFLSMRVLDLERVFKPKLPSALGTLAGLRYLGLRWTYLECLPDHVSKLLNLQVLDVKRTYISTLPKSIWSMRYLRHLYLSETYRSRFVSRPRNKSLTDLLTLWGAFIDEDSPVLNGLDTILNVRKLGLTCRSMSSADKMKSQLEAVGDWILKLEHLEDLRLKSFDDRGDPSDLHLKPLSGHNNLSTIYLVGRLRYPSVVSEFPVNITDITLSRSELEEDPMIALQSLPKLIILRLLSRSTTCGTMKCTEGGFPQLRVLKIWNLEHLEEWELKKGALPSLKDLEIRNCQKLKMIPCELTHLEALRDFKLSDKFAEEIKKKQSSVWNKIKHVLKVDRE